MSQEKRLEEDDGYSVVWVRSESGKGEGQSRKEKLNRWVLRGRAIKRVKAARVGEEPERRPCRARVAEQVGNRWGFETEGGEEGRTRGGVERAVKEEVFAGLRLAITRAEEPFRFEVRPVGAEIASACA